MYVVRVASLCAVACGGVAAPPPPIQNHVVGFAEPVETGVVRILYRSETSGILEIRGARETANDTIAQLVRAGCGSRTYVTEGDDSEMFGPDHVWWLRYRCELTP